MTYLSSNYIKLIFLFLGLYAFYSCANKTQNKSLDNIDLYFKEIIFNDKKRGYIKHNKHNIILGKIKYRGGFSVRYPKKSFTFKAYDPIDLLGDGQAYKKWIFNASYIDKTLMRHKFSYDVFAKFDSNHKIPKSKYITLSIDSNYNGVYVLMEKIGKKKLQVNEDNGGCIFKDPPLFKQKVGAAEVKGNPHHQKTPDLDEHDYNNLLDSLRNIMLNGTDVAFTNMVQAYFDLNNIIDWQILIMLSNNGDGVLKNFYLYRKNKTDKFKIVPWDYDHSFGRDSDNELNMMRQENGWDRNILLNRLYYKNIKNYSVNLKKRWQELRSQKTISKDTLYSMLDRQKAAIVNEIDENFEKWPYNSQFYYDSNTFYQEVDTIKKNIGLRIKYLDNFFNEN